MTVDYKKINFFQKGHEFTLEIYKLTREFPKEEKFGLCSQIQRASSSIGCNIAEGSVKGSTEFKRYLQIALGSAKECEYLLLLAKSLEYISINTYDRLQSELNVIIGSLVNYMKSL